MRHFRSDVQGRARVGPGEVASKKVGLRSTEIADRNFRVILEAIRRYGPLTRLELAQRTGLSGPGITNILRRLGDDGLVTSRRRRDAAKGASSTEFALNPEGAFSIGVRLGGARPEAVLVDLSGQVRERTPLDQTVELPVSLEKAAGHLLSGNTVSDRVLGIGIAARSTGDIGVGQIMLGSRPLRVLVERECVTAVLAERTVGAPVPEGGLVMIIIDHTVEAALLVRGVPFAGVHGRAGSIGAMRTGPDHVRLDSIVGLHALQACLSLQEYAALLAGEELPMSAAISDWVKNAAGHLLDAIVGVPCSGRNSYRR
ncbi:DNA-binding transcriptional ArsR family regulator [Rhizobium leucaenae]|uniref:DNA-binding transcriptional ArsR family regulator n=1 Tax=Rhizobium leucaenae TaxID=29450 RepID=A0A7W6ZVD5_9HYPH|nr:ROK family transcriptional regulator [Rhizobium leucaenae]MBB4569452.1 DNA-binding transcriptional ArsR family regulator [Rhizobium leucaenae]MBB6303882.1 DNA-binding transcriptional ArsR family regulator [Rhizobium leucaenae]